MTTMTRPGLGHDVPDARISVHDFPSDDGLTLRMHRFLRGAGGGGVGGGGVGGGGVGGGGGGGGGTDAVLLVPGATNPGDLFALPGHRNLVTFLLDNGFGDVWTLDGRMSNRLPYLRTRRDNLDDVAHFDYPAAVRQIRAEVGPDTRVHVIAQCLGSVSFLMALAAGTVDGIASVVAAAVGLTPRIPRWSRIKLRFGPFLVERVLRLPYLDPQWAVTGRELRARTLARLVSLAHRECDVPACHMLSFMWGSGRPALYRHANLVPEHHAAIGDLCGATALGYHRHMRRMARAGRAVRADARDPRHAGLPVDYLAAADRIATPLLFVAGEHNQVFARSALLAWQRAAGRPGTAEFAAFPGYGHLDVFLGRRAADDVFPVLVDFLGRHAGGRP